MTYLFFDTETDGLVQKAYPLTDTRLQPHICQIGAILTDEAGRVKAEANLIICPDGFVIPETASKIHGITQADALAYGFQIRGALSLISRMMLKAETVVAHNAEFDMDMMTIELYRHGMNPMKPKKVFCTMKETIDMVKCPPTERMRNAGMTGYKSPKLQESYKHFFGVEFEGAHDAMADVRACKDVFFALRNAA